MQPQNINVTGDGATHTLASLIGAKCTQCRWFQFGLVDGVLNIGDSSTDATHGYPVATGGGSQFAPPVAQDVLRYDLNQWYYYMGNGDTGVLLCVI